MLSELIDSHGEYLERDFLLFYRIELIDVINGKISPRKALSLAKKLPNDSVTKAAGAWGEKYQDWTLQTYFLAVLIEQIMFMRHEYLQSNSKKKIPQPKPMDLPGRKLKKKSGQDSPFAEILRREREYLEKKGRI